MNTGIYENPADFWHPMRTYLKSNIPKELYESAIMDGCRDTTFLLRIVIPLAKPVIAVITLMYAVGHWNSFFSALIYIQDRKLQPLQIILREILIVGETAGMEDDIAQEIEREYMKNLLQFSLIIVASIPIMLLYHFIQKYFVKGIMVGSIKG